MGAVLLALVAAGLASPEGRATVSLAVTRSRSAGHATEPAGECLMAAPYLSAVRQGGGNEWREAVIDGGCTHDAWTDPHAFDMATVKESKVPSMKVGDGTPLPVKFEGDVAVQVEAPEGAVHSSL